MMVTRGIAAGAIKNSTGTASQELIRDPDSVEHSGEAKRIVDHRPQT